MPEYEYAISINEIPTGEGWGDLDFANDLLPRWQNYAHEFGLSPEAFRIIRRSKNGPVEVFDG